MTNRILIASAALVMASLTIISAQSPPSAPSNPRIVYEGEAPRPPRADPIDPEAIGDPPPNGQHPYFEALAARTDVFRTFSLRNQLQLDYYAQKRGGSTNITYDYINDPDPRRQDAAKVIVPPDVNSIPNQVRLPVGFSSGSILVTWDAWFGSEYQFEQTGIGNQKTFQFASPLEGIWCEVRTRFNLVDAPLIGAIESRGYVGGSREYEDAFGPNVTRDLPLSPQLQAFAIRPETWTRYWAVFERTADWDLYSLWVADEGRDPVQLHDRLQLKLREDLLGTFWLEYNTSSNVVRTNGPLVSYVRNVVMLRNVNNPAGLLERPRR